MSSLPPTELASTSEPTVIANKGPVTASTSELASTLSTLEPTVIVYQGPVIASTTEPTPIVNEVPVTAPTVAKCGACATRRGSKCKENCQFRPYFPVGTSTEYSILKFYSKSSLLQMLAPYREDPAQLIECKRNLIDHARLLTCNPMHGFKQRLNELEADRESLKETSIRLLNIIDQAQKKIPPGGAKTTDVNDNAEQANI